MLSDMYIYPFTRALKHVNLYAKNIGVLIYSTITYNKRFYDMLIGYMRISSENDRQVMDMQYDALVKAGVEPRHIFQDKASGVKDHREGLQKALDYLDVIPQSGVQRF